MLNILCWIGFAAGIGSLILSAWNQRDLNRYRKQRMAERNKGGD
jgi:hypothetical protein